MINIENALTGDTANIPDSVMGLTFLAAGTSVPEAVSSVIVTNQGHGAMGISSSISSNTFDILLCLGLPWFVKAYFYPAVEGNLWVSAHIHGVRLYRVIHVRFSLLFSSDRIPFNRSELLSHLSSIDAVRIVFSVCAQQIPFGLENRFDLHPDVHRIFGIRQFGRIECIFPSEFTHL